MIGGARLYREAVPRAQRIYWTRVLADVDGDTFFPSDVFVRDQWKLVSDEEHPASSGNRFPFRFEVYERIPWETLDKQSGDRQWLVIAVAGAVAVGALAYSFVKSQPAPSPPAAMSRRRKSATVVMPVRSAMVLGSPICRVKLCVPPAEGGRWRMVWP